MVTDVPPPVHKNAPAKAVRRGRAVLRRLPGMARLLFYMVTISAALAAVLGTNADDAMGPVLTEWSWYLLLAGMVLFALMVLLQMWLMVRPERRRARGERRGHEHSRDLP